MVDLHLLCNYRSAYDDEIDSLQSVLEKYFLDEFERMADID